MAAIIINGNANGNAPELITTQNSTADTPKAPSDPTSASPLGAISAAGANASSPIQPRIDEAYLPEDMAAECPSDGDGDGDGDGDE